MALCFIAWYKSVLSCSFTMPLNVFYANIPYLTQIGR